MRAILSVAAATLLSVSYVQASSAAETLRMGLLVSNKSLAYQAAEKLAQHVEEATGGEYRIELFPSQQLGSGREMMQMLRLGTLDLYQGTNAQPTYFDEGRNFSTTAAPYCFQSQEEFVRFLSSPLFEEMADQLRGIGIELVGYMGSRSPRAITTRNTQVLSPADMEGLKMRVPGSPPFVAFFEALGAIPTPMPFSEFFTAAQTGLVEGQDNGIEVVYPRGLYEVQKYYAKTDHAMGAWMLFYGQNNAANWPDSLKQAIDEGLEIAAAFNDAELEKSMAEAFEGVQANGMVVVDVDKEPFVAVAREVWAQLDGTNWDEGFMDRVQAQLDEYRN